jgi:hypothetical protein
MTQPVCTPTTQIQHPLNSPITTTNHPTHNNHAPTPTTTTTTRPPSGNNDAWRGYGGAVLYTRARSLPQEIVPDLKAAAESAGLKWEDFKATDNSCGPHPPKASLLQVRSARAAGSNATNSCGPPPTPKLLTALVRHNPPHHHHHHHYTRFHQLACCKSLPAPLKGYSPSGLKER